MANSKFTLTNTYQNIGSGAVTIQKKNRGGGSVMVYSGGSAPTDDTESFEILDNQVRNFPMSEDVWARTPHPGEVVIVVGA